MLRSSLLWFPSLSAYYLVLCSSISHSPCFFFNRLSLSHLPHFKYPSLSASSICLSACLCLCPPAVASIPLPSFTLCSSLLRFLSSDPRLMEEEFGRSQLNSKWKSNLWPDYVRLKNRPKKPAKGRPPSPESFRQCVEGKRPPSLHFGIPARPSYGQPCNPQFL